MKFRIEHRIKLLAKNAAPPSYKTFELDGITYEQWDFNHAQGWIGDAWLASGEVEAPTFTKAVNSFQSRLLAAIRRVAFISQGYADAWAQSFLGTREGSSIGFLRYVTEVKGGGLMFAEHEKEALDLLQRGKEVPEEFFYYWNDAVNAVGYAAKLLLMFSALEALVKRPDGKKDWGKMERILGKKLKEDLYGNPGASQDALRHRLVHAQYFSVPDTKTNYLEQVHKGVMHYFNQEILKRDLLELGVVSPQRHFFGNQREGRFYLEAKPGYPLKLKGVLADLDENGINGLKNFNYVWDKDAQQAFLNEKF